MPAVADEPGGDEIDNEPFEEYPVSRLIEAATAGLPLSTVIAEELTMGHRFIAVAAQPPLDRWGFRRTGAAARA